MHPKATLALAALVLIMLVGCHETADLPNTDVHAATTQTVYCQVDGTEIRSGYVSMWAGATLAESAFTWYHDKITRGHHEHEGDNRPYPNNYGFCTFHVPHFIPIQTPVCTLIYYQSAHNGSVDLDVNWLDVQSTPDWNPEFLYHAAETSSCVVATDNAQTDGWHKVALTQDGSNKLVLCATQQDGGPLVTGLIYTGSIDDGDSATVSLPSNGPYIKVVYETP